MIKRYLVRYYFECMQEDVIEAASQEEAEDKAEEIIGDWDMTTPRVQFVDSPHNDVEVMEIKEDK